MPYLFRSAVLLLLALGYVALPVLAAGAKKEDPQMEPRLLPWNLRDHYTFSPEGYDFIYGGDNGQWSLEKKGLGFLMDKVNASITFADGKTVEAALHGVGTTVRQKHTAELGPGIEYIVNIPAKDGFSLRHSLAYHNEHPFYLVRLALKNEGTTPLEVSQISSVIIPPGSLKQLGSNATVTHRRVLMHGKSPVYSKDVEPHATFINDPANGLVLGLGSIATGQCKTIVDLQPFSGAWQGSVTSTFDPPVRVEPGQSLQGDPVWISFTTLTQADVDLFFAHALKDYPKYAKADDAPHSWVTVPDGGSFSELQSAIGDWSGVAAALVPVTWESRGGSLDGATPAWPREMRGVASQLRQNGRAGITVDPLAVANGNDAWAAKSEDGQMWLNPATEEGMANGVAQMKKVAAWGFDFYVVARSRIPNEVLKHFNITRSRADALAIDMMIAAAGGAPVFGASNGTLGGERDEWLDAAAATARLAEYSLLTGPVRLDAAKAREISDETATAIAFCGAPIEVVGNPTESARKAIVDAVSKRDYFARPLEIATSAPKLWQVETTPGGSKENLAITVVSFEGARASTDGDLKTYSGTPKTTAQETAAGFVSKLPAALGGPKKGARR